MEAKLQEIKEIFFKSKYLKVVPNIEGNDVDFNKGVLSFGMTAGPETNISNLLHEMAHFIEIDDERCLSYGWGLKLPWVQIGLYPGFFEAKDDRPCQREMSVFAIQLAMLRHFGIEDKTDFGRVIVKWTPGSSYLLGESDAEKIRLVNQRIKSHASFHTMESLINEWNRKVAIVEEQLQMSKFKIAE